MIHICVITSTRADYGLLKPILIKLKNNRNFNINLVVTGSHTLIDYGDTKNFIKQDFDCFHEIKIHDYNDNALSITLMMGKLLTDFGNLFEHTYPDFIMLLGDRFEIMAIAIVATIFNIKIIHLCGGDVTSGSFDDYFRNCISMMSHIHFTTNKFSMEKLLSFGKNNVFVSGHPTLEWINDITLVDKHILEKELAISFNKTNILIMFHPETTNNNTFSHITEIMKFVDKIMSDEISVFIIGSNIDNNNKIINTTFRKKSENTKNVYFFMSLDQQIFFNLAKNCDIYIGNSSSGIYELPYLMHALINIGNRQDGRFLSGNTIQSDINSQSIYDSFILLLSGKFIYDEYFPYPSLKTSTIILETLQSLLLND